MVSKAFVSSNIKQMGHHNGGLFILFNSGVAYEYPEVPHKVYEDACEAESVGKFFHHAIKDKFLHLKLDFDPFAQVKL